MCSVEILYWYTAIFILRKYWSLQPFENLIHTKFVTFDFGLLRSLYCVSARLCNPLLTVFKSEPVVVSPGKFKIFRMLAMASTFLKVLDHTQRRTKVGRISLDEWSALRRDLYLATHNTHNRQTSRHPAGFEPTISAGERPQTYAIDRAATGTGDDDENDEACRTRNVCGKLTF